MRILFCGVAALALSGCSWLGLGGNRSNPYTDPNVQCCVGDRALSKWNFEIGGGVEFPLGETAISGSQAAAGFPNRTLNDVSFNDAYDIGYRAEYGGSYAVNPNRKVTVQGTYTRANSNDIAIGTQNSNELRGQLSNYTAYGLEAGLRQYIRPVPFPLIKSVRPYIEAKIGGAYVDDISLNNVREVGALVPAAPIDIAFYEGGWVPTAAGLIGVETPLFKRFTVGIETGIRFVGNQKSDNTNTANGFEQFGGANNGGDRYSIPVTIRGRYRF